MITSRQVSYWLRRALLAALLVTSGITLSRGPDASAQGSCGPNAIVCENQNTGAPASEWDVVGAGDPTIQGFATAMSVNRGQVVHFKVKTDAVNYQMKIYRLGYYGGLGARLMATVTPSATLPQAQPSCITDATVGLLDCGNWAESGSWAVPSTATSGIYVAKLLRPDTGGSSHIVFVVRDDAGHSDLLFQTSDTTWQAYNAYGGNSLYYGSSGARDTRAYKVSYNRPVTTRGTAAGNSLFNAEYPMVRWLEANGYDVSYISGIDTDRSGATLVTPANHHVFMSVGHDEYWSAGQRANVEAARGAGMHLAFFSGNEVFWKTRWEASIDGTSTPYRTLVSYKETHADAKIDPQDPPTWTGTWRDPRFSPPADGGRPENALTGTLYTAQCCQAQFPSISVPAAAAAYRFWRNTPIAASGGGTLTPRVSGSSVGAGGVLGYEFDEDLDNGFRPGGLMDLSSTTATIDERIQDYGTNYVPGSATHSLTLYRHTSGALVFGAGTVQWSWGLDNAHDRLPDATSDYTNLSIRQATVNLLADMGAQPSTIQADLTASAASADVIAPVSTITSPASGASVLSGSPVTVSGTATDNGGHVAVVEVSFDGGTTWHRANGRESWSISWTLPGIGAASIKSRAIDDSGNVETPSGGVTVNVTCPCTMWSDSTTPSVVDTGDPSGVELGVKFRSDVSGFITGIRFYKSAANTGTHVGHLFSSTGAVLASATFTTETASGWQQVMFSSPVAIDPDTNYVAAYHTSSGHYSATSSYFATAGFDNAPLHAVSNVSTPNGVYDYGAGSFPSQSYKATNYWVDVVFTTAAAGDTTPPVVTSVTPANGALGVVTSTNVTIAFNEALASSSVNTSTIELRTSANAPVAGAVSYNASTKTVTFTPTAALSMSAIYTVIAHGGTSGARVTDAAGNALANNFTSTFTTVAPGGCPCTIWDPASAGPAVVDTGDTNPVELGVKFRADQNGLISGIKFYKSAANTGTHVGNLWTASGSLLATATFSGETASGWQQVTFSSPVAITANTTYVASYHTTVGHYSASGAFFATSGVDTPPLHALANTTSSNGVYQYGNSSFPSSSYNATNYWVDVVFSSGSGADTTPPSVQSVSPTPGTAAPATTLVTATFNEAMTAASINASTFDLRDASNAVVNATIAYNSTTHTASLTPTVALTGGATYTARVHGGSGASVQDAAGNALAADVSWSFTVTTGATCPCTLWTSPTVGLPDAGDSSAVELGVKFRSDVDGFITGVRYFKSAANTGTHVGNLWTAGGVQLATATFVNESSTGWQQVIFGTPVAIAANTTYVASYHTDTGHYAATANYFVQQLDAAPLHAIANGNAGNGVFTYGAGGFPTSSFNATNYWVDVIFTAGAFVDTTATDFGRGSMDAGAFVGSVGDGEVTLAPVASGDFDGTTMPAGWSGVAWGASPHVDVSGGALHLGGARAQTDAFFGPTHTLEFTAIFSGAPYEHAGFGLTLNETPWAIFSSGPGDGLYARSNNGTTATDTPIAGSWFGSAHRFRIQWGASTITYAIDGTTVATHSIAIAASMRPIASDYVNDGRVLTIDAVRLTPYAATGTFTSRILDGTATVHWTGALWAGTAPAGTSVTMSVRFGDTPSPDATWTSFSPVVNGTIAYTSRYMQYRLDLSSSDSTQTPTVNDVTISYVR